MAFVAVPAIGAGAGCSKRAVRRPGFFPLRVLYPPTPGVDCRTRIPGTTMPPISSALEHLPPPVGARSRRALRRHIRERSDYQAPTADGGRGLPPDDNKKLGAHLQPGREPTRAISPVIGGVRC